MRTYASYKSYIVVHQRVWCDVSRTMFFVEYFGCGVPKTE